jgi:hypothetical protein
MTSDPIQEETQNQTGVKIGTILGGMLSTIKLASEMSASVMETASSMVDKLGTIATSAASALQMAHIIWH